MPPEPPKDGNLKKLDREARDMVTAIMSRIPDLHKPGSSQSENDDDDDHGVKIITLAGNNVGATLKTDMDENSGDPGEDLTDGMSTYVNSNFQALNNSIMMGGTYTSNDPGVHLDVSDYVEHRKGRETPEKHGKKAKKKDKESGKSDQQASSDKSD